MPYDMILPSRKIIVSRDNVIDPPMKISSIVFEEKEMFRQMSLKFQLASFYHLLVDVLKLILKGIITSVIR